MMERYWSSLKKLWLFISLICILAPVFIPTPRYPTDLFHDPMGTSTFIMFILSLPMSLFALPAIMMEITSYAFVPNSIMPAYLNLLFLTAMGAVQWFWVVPRISWENEPELQILDLHTPASPAAALGEAYIDTDLSFFDSNSKTPVDRVIDDYSEK
jgi:hypothetical protein